VELYAVASRAQAKADAFATAHGLPRAYGSYDALLADPDVDAVYVTLPTGLHAEWVERALRAGKHVLCEKPLAAHAGEVATIAACAQAHGRIVQEALQTRYSSRLRRQRELVANGALGAVRRIDACFRVPRLKLPPDDFRLRFELGGGSGLDFGCYAVTCLRYVTGEEPAVLSARCRELAPRIDRWMRAELRFPSRISGSAECGFRGWYLPRIGVTVHAERGWIRWTNKGLVYRLDGRRHDEVTAPDWMQQRQLEAFVRRCNGWPSEGLPVEDSLATARVIDDMYRAAGLPLRGRENAC
jgi:predicted dehydrogenase